MDYIINDESEWNQTVSSPRGSGKPDYVDDRPSAGITAQEVAEIVAKVLGSLRVYVVESDITDAQNSVKTVVEQSTF